jgi:hypothetical protein
MEFLLGAMVLGGIAWYFVSRDSIRASYERGYYDGRRAGVVANVQRQSADDDEESPSERRFRARASGQL